MNPVNPSLERRHILIVEDEFHIADALCDLLTGVGAVVVGPEGSVAGALRAIDSAGQLDAAVLDANLGGELSLPVAVRLQERGVPFLLMTGYDASALPVEMTGFPRCEKPVRFASLASHLGALIGT